jgi:hypothetical protein
VAPPSLGERLQQPPPLLIPVWSLARRTHGLALILAAFENQLFLVHSNLRFSCVQIEVLGGLKFLGFLEQQPNPYSSLIFIHIYMRFLIRNDELSQHYLNKVCQLVLDGAFTNGRQSRSRKSQLLP